MLAVQSWCFCWPRLSTTPTIYRLCYMLIPGQNIAKCVGGDYPVLVIDLCPKGGALAHFQSQGDSKKHTNILIIAAQKCPMAGALARMNC